MSRAIEEGRIILHELRGVNVKVDFFLGTRKDLTENNKRTAYSVCWEAVDVRVDLITFTEQISELDFRFSAQQLVLGDHVISGEVIEFSWEADEHGTINALCKILISLD